MNKTLGIVIVILIVVAGAYYTWSPLVQEPVPQIENVKISLAAAAVNKFLIAVIKDKGIDKKNYLDIEVIYSDPGESERKVADKADGIEMGNYSPISIVETNANKRLQLRAFAPLLNNSFFFLVKKDSKYQNINDLKGARVALRPKASAAYKATALAMKIAGLDLENDFKLSFGSLPESIAKLEGGEVDVTVLPGIDTALLLASGKYRTVYDLGKKWEEAMGNPMPFVSMAAHKDWLDQNPKKALRVRAMLIEANEYINKNPQSVVQYAETLGIKSPEAEKLAIQYAPALYPTKWLPNLHTQTVQKAVELKILPSFPAENPFVN